LIGQETALLETMHATCSSAGIRQTESRTAFPSSNKDSFQAASTKRCTQERTQEHNRAARREGRRDGTKLKRGFLVTENKRANLSSIAIAPRIRRKP
jgi:hypothetical protein